jgi:hypothetical protein
MDWENQEQIKQWYENKATVIIDAETTAIGCFSVREGVVGIMDAPPDPKNRVISIDGIKYYAYSVNLYDPVEANLANEISKILLIEIQKEIDREVLCWLDKPTEK